MDKFATFRRVSDIYHFKAILDTWVSLNAKMPENHYREQVRRMLPSVGRFDTKDKSATVRKSEAKSKSRTRGRTSYNPSLNVTQTRTELPKSRDVSYRYTNERDARVLNTAYISGVKNNSAFTPIINRNLETYDSVVKNNFASAENRTYDLDGGMKSKYGGLGPQNRLGANDIFYDDDGNVHYNGDVVNGMAHGDGTLYWLY